MDAHWKMQQQNTFLAIPLSLLAVLLSLGYWTYVTGFQFTTKRQTRVPKGAYPSGLYNLGNTCFVNGVLQALASVDSLLIWIDSSVERRKLVNAELERTIEGAFEGHDSTLLDTLAEKAESTPPVTMALQDLLNALNETHAFPMILSAKTVLGALTMTRGSRRLMGYEQQDAHELFQAVTSSLVKEMEGVGTSGVGVVPLFQSLPVEDEKRASFRVLRGKDSLQTKQDTELKFPFTGLLASRLSCVKCGYKTPISHETFDNLSLSVPQTPRITLSDLLKDHFSVERISGWACDGCSLQATLKRIQGEVEKVKERLEVLNCVRMECKREIEGPVVAVVDGLKDGTPTKSTKEESPSTGTKKTKKKSPPDSTPEAKKESLMDSLTSTKKESPLDSITSTKTLDSTSTTITKTELVPDSNNNSSTKKKKKKTRRDPLKQLQKTEKEIRASLESLVSLTKDLSIVQRHAQCYPEDPLPKGIPKERQESPLTYKKSLLARLPQCLSLHMQRSVFLYSGSVVKNNCVVELSEFLDLTGVTVCGSGQGEEECYFGRELGEAHGWTGSLSVSQDDKKVAPITAPDDAPEEKETRTNTKARGMYVMVAVVVHYGTHESGHFVTYRRIRSGQWVCVSDESVQVVTQKNVFEMASRYAYLVFYERVCDKNQ